MDDEKKQELETLRTELRTIVGRAIVSGLISPGGGGFYGLFRDYEQAGGDYTQSDGGNHIQDGGGNYTQSSPPHTLI
jgi:hypothetical protein